MDNALLLHNLIRAPRFLMMQVTNIGIFYLLVLRLLPNRRSLRLWNIYVCADLLYRFLFFGILHNIYPTTAGLQFLYLFTVVTFSMLFYVCALYAFSGDWPKIVLTTGLTDIGIATVAAPVAYGLGYLEGRSNFLDLTGRFMWADLLYPLILFSLYALLIRLFGPFLDRLAVRNIKYRRLQILASALIISVPMFSITVPWQANGKWILVWMKLLVFLLLFILGIAGSLGVHIYRLYAARIAREHAFLQTQNRFMRLYRKEILAQIQTMEQNQKLIDTQMEAFTSGKWEETAAQTIRKYLENLKRQYASVQTGIYSDDRSLDAILSQITRMLKGKGYQPELSVSGYPKSLPGTDAVGETLLLLLSTLETALPTCADTEESPVVALSLGIVRNQTLLHLDFPFRGKAAPLLREIKKKLKPLQGELLARQESTRIQISIMLPQTAETTQTAGND